MPQFFIRRPIVAMVISIIIVLLGGFILQGLAVEQYPSLAPPVIQVSATYPGASAEVVEQSVATPIEQQVNGVDNMIYMKSTNTSDGRMSLSVSFEVGTDEDMDNVLVQNRVSQAQARLPQEVIQQGVTVSKMNPSILMVVSMYSPGGSRDALFLDNYAAINVRDALLRVNGVAKVDLLGAEYGMRVWLRPDRLTALGLTPTDVMNAIREQNLQAPAGQVGAAPSATDQQYTYTVRAPGRLTTPEAFGDIIVREGTGSQIGLVRLKDVARVELGGENYRSFGQSTIRNPEDGSWVGGPSTSLILYLMPGANQVVTAENLYHALEELEGFFPSDMAYEIVYDTTPAIEASIEAILHTLVEAFLLVSIVVFIFLQSWRATLIPLITVPISLIGTFIFFPLLGFSVNTLTMFGLVLAIGIVVDDAIVVVEAVMHKLEHGMQPLEATQEAMREVTGPVIAVTLVMVAVFVPVGLLGGLTGRLYQQFALTIAISVVISAFLALSLAPALCAKLLRPPTPTGGPLGRFYGAFNRTFARATDRYVNLTGMFVRRGVLALAVVTAAVVLAGGVGKLLPKGFVPDEDMGIFLINVQLPPASSLERTRLVVDKVQAEVQQVDGITACTAIGGYGIITNSYSPEYAAFFCRLAPWDERDESRHVTAIGAQLAGRFRAIPEAVAFAFSPPTVPGFGASGGFSLMLQDRSGTMTVQELGANLDAFVQAARQRPEISNLFTSFNPRTPQLQVELDREKARTLGVPINDVFAALQASLGGAYVNDFNRFGRLYRVYVQAESEFRQEAGDIGLFRVRSRSTGEMVPLSTLVTTAPVSGTETTTRYNLFRSVELSGSPGPGYSSGQAIAALEEVAAQVLPREMAVAWSGMSYQEETAPPSGPTFALAIIFVFLLLAAQYESWKLPWAVLLATPLVVLGALSFAYMAGYDNNVFIQVGLIMLVGLAAKNAILIVEFAKMQKDGGKPIEEAALEGARLRLRPILMTSFAFILGVVPLMISSGAGAAAQNRMGTAVFGGMLTATIVGVFLVPGLFAFVERLGSKRESVPVGATEVGS